MGYFRNHAIVVSDYDDKRIERAQAAALVCFAKYGLDGLVSNVVKHAINGGAAFFISPDGSKEGWGYSEKGNKARAEFISWIKSDGGFLEWAEIILGGDDGEYKIEQSPNGSEPYSSVY